MDKKYWKCLEKKTFVKKKSIFNFTRKSYRFFHINKKKSENLPNYDIDFNKTYLKRITDLFFLPWLVRKSLSLKVAEIFRPGNDPNLRSVNAEAREVFFVPPTLKLRKFPPNFGFKCLSCILGPWRPPVTIWLI